MKKGLGKNDRILQNASGLFPFIPCHVILKPFTFGVDDTWTVFVLVRLLTIETKEIEAQLQSN